MVNVRYTLDMAKNLVRNIAKHGRYAIMNMERTGNPRQSHPPKTGRTAIMASGQRESSVHSQAGYSLRAFISTMKYVSRSLGNCPLDQYDMVKVHVLADFQHILNYGEPIIGGVPSAWEYGPVVKPSYVQAMTWVENGGEFTRMDASCTHKKGGVYMIPTAQITDRDVEALSPDALASIGDAWSIHERLSFDESYKYFHTNQSALGAAWEEADKQGRLTPINWCRVIDIYDAMNGTDHGHVKVLLNPPSNDALVTIAKSSPPPKDYWWSEQY